MRSNEPPDVRRVRTTVAGTTRLTRPGGSPTVRLCRSTEWDGSSRRWLFTRGWRSMDVTVGTVVGLLAAGRTSEEILKAYPYLEADDIREALAYAAWRAEEQEVPLAQP
jgi:hypothetical protein